MIGVGAVIGVGTVSAAAIGWQDAVAVGLAILGLAVAWLLYRRFAKPSGCARCPLQEDEKEF